jgi:hypothetical protein
MSSLNINIFPKFVMKCGGSWRIGHVRSVGAILTKIGSASEKGVGWVELSHSVKNAFRQSEGLKSKGEAVLMFESSVLGFNESGFAIEGLSQRSLISLYSFICGQEEERVRVKWSRAKKWVRGNEDGVGDVGRRFARRVGMMRPVAPASIPNRIQLKI